MDLLDATLVRSGTVLDVRRMCRLGGRIVGREHVEGEDGRPLPCVAVAWGKSHIVVVLRLTTNRRVCAW